jgi:hypothetical protein
MDYAYDLGGCLPDNCTVIFKEQLTTTQSSTMNKSNKNHSVHLSSDLSKHFQKVLPNPMNEVAGVFHLKLYIIDDELMLWGANLSHEYFVDRCDRYLWIVQGGGGLVDCSSRLIWYLLYASPYSTVG